MHEHLERPDKQCILQLKFAEGLATHLTSGTELDTSASQPFEDLLATLPADPAMASLLEPLVMPMDPTQPAHTLVHQNCTGLDQQQLWYDAAVEAQPGTGDDMHASHQPVSLPPPVIHSACTQGPVQDDMHVNHQPVSLPPSDIHPTHTLRPMQQAALPASDTDQLPPQTSGQAHVQQQSKGMLFAQAQRTADQIPSQPEALQQSGYRYPRSAEDSVPAEQTQSQQVLQEKGSTNMSRPPQALGCHHGPVQHASQPLSKAPSGSAATAASLPPCQDSAGICSQQHPVADGIPCSFRLQQGPSVATTSGSAAVTAPVISLAADRLHSFSLPEQAAASSQADLSGLQASSLHFKGRRSPHRELQAASVVDASAQEQDLMHVQWQKQQQQMHRQACVQADQQEAGKQQGVQTHKSIQRQQKHKQVKHVPQGPVTQTQSLTQSQSKQQERVHTDRQTLDWPLQQQQQQETSGADWQKPVQVQGEQQQQQQLHHPQSNKETDTQQRLPLLDMQSEKGTKLQHQQPSDQQPPSLSHTQSQEMQQQQKQQQRPDAYVLSRGSALLQPVRSQLQFKQSDLLASLSQLPGKAGLSAALQVVSQGGQDQPQEAQAAALDSLYALIFPDRQS